MIFPGSSSFFLQAAGHFVSAAVQMKRCALKIIKLELGRRPDNDTDCVKIEETSDGRFALTGTALCQQSYDDIGSVSLVETATFERLSEAEEAGIVWANAQGVQVLYVGYGTLDHPIAQSEIDGPL